MDSGIPCLCGTSQLIKLFYITQSQPNIQYKLENRGWQTQTARNKIGGLKSNQIKSNQTNSTICKGAQCIHNFNC
jgi:hypothetical protein